MAKKNYLITGVPGAGKTTICQILTEKGFDAIDTDLYPDFSNWFAKDTGDVVRRPDEGVASDWLNQHSYNWDEEVLQQVLDTTGEATFICESSSNQQVLLDRFDKVFLLKADEELILGRLATRIGTDHYGKTEGERQHVLTWYEAWQDRFIEQGAIPIDAARPPGVVADLLLKETGLS